MVKFTPEELRRIMDKKNNIRNMSVIAHVDHGKSTLTDSLVAAAGIIGQEVACDSRMTDTRADEVERGITIKSTALRITDGALVVVDCIEGFSVQTGTVLRQALGERIRPVLAVNKMGRCFLELQLEGEEAYQSFSRVIKNANVIMATYEDKLLGDVMVCPEKGTVAFSAGLHGWAFTLTNFAKMYASKYGVDEAKMMERLWGENFFDRTTKKWTSKHTGSTTCYRGFVLFCYEPIKEIINACMNDQKDKLWPMLQEFGVTMKNDEMDLMGKALMKRVMQTWLPASPALLEMIVYHLPFPSKAQRYRVENLYEGPLDDIYATAIRDCDPEGPLMLYVSKMIPASDKGRFFAFGRVFAGKVATGQKVRIMGPNYVPGQKKDLFVKSVQRTVIWMGKKQESVEDVPCGNTVAMVGLDQFITNNATLTNKSVYACPIRAMKFSVSPVVRVAVQCKVASDLPKLVEGLKSLEKSDLMARCVMEESGEHVIAGVGELHLEVCLEDLQKNLVGGAETIVSPFELTFRETVLDASKRDVTCKFKNKHNYLCMKALPLENEVLEAISGGRFNPTDNSDLSSKFLSVKLNWGEGDMENFWCFGQETTGPNMLIDKSKRLTNEIKNSVISGFRSAAKRGVLADEEMQGISFMVSDVALCADVNQRGLDRVALAAQRATLASQLLAKPRLLEPVYLVKVLAPKQALNAVYGVLNEKGVEVLKKKMKRFGESMWYISEGRLPVQDSFGFSKELSCSTSGQAVSLLMFDNQWEIMSSDPLNAQSPAAYHVNRIRKMKGLNLPITTLSDLVDKL